MAISNIGVVSGITYEGGSQTYAFSKTKDAVAVPAGNIPAGTYYLAASAYGSLNVKTYNTDNSVGYTLGELLATGARTGIYITVPAGIGGLYLTGSYFGPLSLQVLNPSKNTSISESVSYQSTSVDPSGQSWHPVNGVTNLMWSIDSSSKKTMIFNVTTGVVTVSSNAVVDGNGSTNNTASMASNGTVIVTTSGSASSANNGRIYSSSNGGASWTASSTTYSTSLTSDTDARQVRYKNGTFIISTGNGSTASGKYFYSTDGTTWSVGANSLPGYNIINFDYFASASLWINWTPNASPTYYTATSLAGPWTARTFPLGSGGYSLRGIFFVNNRMYGNVSRSAGSEWAWTTDGINWTNDSTGQRSSFSPVEYHDNVYYSGGLPYFGCYNSSNQSGINYISASNVNTSYLNSGKTSDSYWLYPWNGGMAAYFYYNYSTYSNVENPISANTRIGGAPLASGSSAGNIGGYGGTYFFSQTFNKWYLISYTPGDSTTRLYVANTAGSAGISGSWTLLTTYGAVLQSARLTDTGTSLLIITSQTYIYRSTNGTSFTQITTPASPNLGTYQQDIAVRNGRIVVGTTTANTVMVSVDDGLSWVTVATGRTGTEGTYVYKYSGGFIAVTNNNGYIDRSPDGFAWTQGPLASTNIWVLNDRLISMNSASPYPCVKTPVGVFTGTTQSLVTSTLTNPLGANQTSFYKAGNSFVAMYANTAMNTFYTSVDLVTWTARSFSNTAAKLWNISNNDYYLVAGYSNGSTQENTLEVNRVVNTLTIS